MPFLLISGSFFLDQLSQRNLWKTKLLFTHQKIIRIFIHQHYITMLQLHTLLLSPVFEFIMPLISIIFFAFTHTNGAAIFLGCRTRWTEEEREKMLVSPYRNRWNGVPWCTTTADDTIVIIILSKCMQSTILLLHHVMCFPKLTSCPLVVSTLKCTQ